jgi:dTDP-4-dehydrorhamnose 3,5-epimerase
MRFVETKLLDGYKVQCERFVDERGYFARVWDQSELTQLGLDSSLVQCSLSFNHKKGTVRGMHFQVHPYAETKLVRCSRGALYDVMIDLRPESATFKQWVGSELTSDNGMMLYIPKGFAHGFQTLEDNTEIFYQISSTYVKDAQRGVRWNDPQFGIEWPCATTVINQRDATYPDFEMSVLTGLASGNRTE